MRTSILNAVRGYFRFSNRWLFRTPERALEEAYEAALTIRSIEEQHFGGNKITAANAYGDSVQTYFQEELRRCLNVIKIRLAEFRISRTILQFSTTRPITEIELNNPQEGGDLGRIEVIDRPAIILRKLRFIDEVFSRYTAQNSPQSAVIPVVDANQLANTPQNGGIDRLQNDSFQSNLSTAEAKIASDDIESIVDKTGVLPRSILKTVDRIKRELDPNAEREVVENFRSSKARTVVSLRLVLLFIVVPLLTQQVSKIVLVGPIVDHLRNNESVEIFLNEEMEEEAFTTLNRYEEQLKFQMLIGKIEPMTEEELEENLRGRAEALAEEYQGESNDAVKNVFADMMAVAAFVLLVLSSRREIAVLKSFLDELVYGLSDSAKAFIIILLTDTFVGFHSPHGWEVLLEGVSRHLGLPANRDFIFLFIATFPVILDTIFKYWIFRYLNRISPSAVATYRNMNE